jgi:hypothetical protein
MEDTLFLSCENTNQKIPRHETTDQQTRDQMNEATG